MPRNNWSYKAGEKGRNRVRAYQGASAIFLEWYEDRTRRARSTGHNDREKAKRQADETAAKLGELGTISRDSGYITLQRLFDIYGSEVTPQKSQASSVASERLGR